jgi:uncharacterized protein
MPELFKILAIDGGGMRGILPAMMVAELERRSGLPASQMFDLIAGSSTGGLLAMGLVTPDEQGNPQYTAEDLAWLYEREGPRIFSRGRWRLAQTLNNLTSPRYTSEPFDQSLRLMFGDLRLADAIGNVLITSYELQRRQPWFFLSQRARQSNAHNFRMRDVVRATTAAPTYFEPAQIYPPDAEDAFALIDGSMQANNPALAAWVEAQSQFPDTGEYMIVSLGTGDASRPISYREARQWGMAGWSQHILGIAFDAMNSTVDYQLRHLMPRRADGRQQYYRFQTRLDSANEDLDDASAQNIEALKRIGNQMIESYDAQFDEVVEDLLIISP